MSIELNVDFCNYEAAKYACLNWHYSKSMPAGKIVKIGVWENNEYIGCILFSRGANNNIGKPYGLTQLEICELTRVALNNHSTPTTQIIARAIKLFKNYNTGIKLIVSYADMEQNHIGIIYQAGNWIYEGYTESKKTCPPVELFGKMIHSRTINNRYGTANIDWLRNNVDKNARRMYELKGKHK